jgi:hypothetical protein
LLDTKYTIGAKITAVSGDHCIGVKNKPWLKNDEKLNLRPNLCLTPASKKVFNLTTSQEEFKSCYSNINEGHMKK